MFFPKTVTLRNYATPKQTDQLKQVKEAVCGALLSWGQALADETDDEVLPLTRFELYELKTKQVLDLELDDEVCSG